MKAPNNGKQVFKDNESTDKNLRYLAGFFDTLIQIDLAHKRKLSGVKSKKQSYNVNAKDKDNEKK